jgi:broad specificity phosphatase PhoE
VIAFVRHGETPPNRAGLLLGRSDAALTDKGLVQAERLAAAFSGFDVARVLTSPLRRACDTAAPVAAACGRSVEVDDRLIEIDYGEWEGRPFADLDPDVVARWRRDGGFVPPGGESLEVVAGRVASFCDEWLGDRVVVAVSHVSPIKAAVTWTFRVPPELAWRMRLDVASITRIGRGPVLLSFNESAVTMRI